MFHYVLQTAPNAEFKARAELERLGMRTTLPIQKAIRRSRNARQKKQATDRPVLSGYIVISAPEIPWMAIWALKPIRGVVAFAGQPARISQAIVEEIKAMSQLETKHLPFKPGDEVQIIDAPWSYGVMKIEAITDKKAQVIFEMFGAKRKTTVPVEKLQAAI